MPRFFFDRIEGQDHFWDDSGRELSCNSEAKHEAHRAVADIARKALAGGYCQTFKCHVRDESNRLIYRATLSIGGQWL